MTLAELVTTARTCRRFKGAVALPPEVLSDLVELARFCPSARNLQPLRYVLINTPEAREAVFARITLGAALKPEQRATADQHPGGYIVVLGPVDLSIHGGMDVGIAAQTINLAAAEAGLACCMIGAFNKPALMDMLGEKMLNGLEPKLVLALGVPDEERRVGPVGKDGSVAYFRDADDVHWVPKRALDDVIVGRL